MKPCNLFLLAMLMSSGQVLAGVEENRLTVQTGERLAFPTGIQDGDGGVNFHWSIVTRPEGSLENLSEQSYTAELSDSPGSTEGSFGDLVFIPDVPGDYLFMLEISGNSSRDTSPDDAPVVEYYPVTAVGEPVMGGCATASGSGHGLLAFLGILIGCLLVSGRRNAIKA